MPFLSGNSSVIVDKSNRNYQIIDNMCPEFRIDNFFIDIIIEINSNVKIQNT